MSIHPHPTGLKKPSLEARGNQYLCHRAALGTPTTQAFVPGFCLCDLLSSPYTSCPNSTILDGSVQCGAAPCLAQTSPNGLWGTRHAAGWAALGKAQKEKSWWGLKDRPDQNGCCIASLSRGLMVLSMKPSAPCTATFTCCSSHETAGR